MLHAASTLTRSRPADFAAYSATSARAINESPSVLRSLSSGPGLTSEIPIDAVIVTDSPFGNAIGDCCDLPANAFREFRRRVDVRSRQQYDELFTAVTRRNITRAHLGFDAHCELTQNGIACRMAPGVVDPFEVINIEHQADKP